MNSKGQFTNYGVIILFLFVFGIITIISYTILASFFAVFATLPEWSSVLASTSDRFLYVLKAFDFITVVITVMFLISLALTSWKINTSKAFFIVSFTLAAFFGFIGYISSYAFGVFISNPIFATVTPHFPRTIILCTNFHWIAMASYVVGSVTLYAKKQTGGEFVE